jgi:hypothetical protein
MSHADPREETVKLVILSTVTGVWALAFMLDIFIDHFEVPGVVHGLMASIIGYFIGSRLKNGKHK